MNNDEWPFTLKSVFFRVAFLAPVVAFGDRQLRENKLVSLSATIARRL